ncbi:MAG: ATP phosphoribosyltransferase regulatory subunit [Anaerolineae bacterium]|nr:ATP phosphoribosyltransferase regulatory subunit [Anaerolineae bacterium]
MAAHRPFAGALPCGVRDLFLEEAARLTFLEDTWRELFQAWAYLRVIPPTYEHYDILLLGSGVELEEQVFRVLDREGNILALRSDLTTQVARIVGTKLHDHPLPLRFYYLANVFRYEEPQAGRQREFRQAGIELIGAAGAEADAEVLSLTVEALRRAGLREFQLNVGHLGLFHALASEAGLTPAEIEPVRACLNRKDVDGLAEVLARRSGHTPTDALLRLPGLCGGPEILAEASRLSEHFAAQAAVERLQAIHQALERRQLASHVIFDLGETRGMGYYTGIAFEGFAPGLGFPVCSGGRYDELIGRYGPARPAVGVALVTERVLLALDRADASLARPDLLVAASVARSNWREVEQLRGSGWRVEADVLDLGEQELRRLAAARGVPYLALASEGDRVLLAEHGVERWLPWQALAEGTP